MWNQTGEADWGSEMDRHSPTGPWLCCRRSVDYMTEGGTEGKGEARGCKWRLYRGIHPRKRIAFTPKAPFPLTKARSALTLFSNMQSRPVRLLPGRLLWCAAMSGLTAFINCDNTHYSKWFRELLFFLYLFQQWSGGLFLTEQQITSERLQK